MSTNVEIGKTVIGPERASTCGKYCYADKRAAQTAVNFRKRDHEFKRGKTKHLRAYHCDACNGWHLTHNRLRTFRRPH